MSSNNEYYVGIVTTVILFQYFQYCVIVLIYNLRVVLLNGIYRRKYTAMYYYSANQITAVLDMRRYCITVGSYCTVDNDFYISTYLHCVHAGKHRYTIYIREQ